MVTQSMLRTHEETDALTDQITKIAPMRASISELPSSINTMGTTSLSLNTRFCCYIPCNH